jgi:hypothetical protein
MSENGADAPEQVVKFAPRGQPRSYDAPVEEAGQAIVAKIRRASELANETCDRAMKLAHKLSLESVLISLGGYRTRLWAWVRLTLRSHAKRR